MICLFESFEDAAHKLSASLLDYKGINDTVIMGILHAGAIMAHTLAQELNLPWDVLGIKKIGVPFDPELAVGAVAPDGSFYVDEVIKDNFNVAESYIDQTRHEKLDELVNQLSQIRGSSSYGNIAHNTIILTDDGIATGATMHAAIRFVKAQGTKAVVVAVPVISMDRLPEFKQEVDKVYALLVPEDFMGVGEFYTDFTQPKDSEIAELFKHR
ncbi:phosphoribosyltransferase [Coprothermobacter platensis]|uniref:phosphoribosyltransferase n=1 Tax=Coprothermobacter platensis TaxID=108819 RepID=UPI0012EA8403|nr:phosphoribosyltransferase family protein [Coprothermobacter platensis]